jgi:hypothetical protein
VERCAGRLGADAGLERLVGEPLALGEVAVEDRQCGSQPRRRPAVIGLAQRLGFALTGLEFALGGGDVAEFAQVAVAPGVAEDHELAVASLLGRREQLGREREALGRVGAPDRDVARVERGGERRRIAEPARLLHRLRTELFAAPLLPGGDVQFGGHARADPDAQLGIAVADAAERVLAELEQLLVDVVHTQPLAAEPERGAAEQRAIVALARELGGGQERLARAHALAGA